jgi:hypothetical protein
MIESPLFGVRFAASLGSSVFLVPSVGGVLSAVVAVATLRT